MSRRPIRSVLLACLTTITVTGALVVTTGGAAGAASRTAGSTSHVTQGTPGTSGDVTSPQPLSNADLTPGGANNGGDCGAYCSTRDRTASGNGNGGGQSVGKPCAGCVGRADNKNPPGQFPNGSDLNNGYECDGNHGIARTNPAHTGCSTGVSACTPSAANNFCAALVPSCTPSAANNFCATTPPACVPSQANNLCSTVLGVRSSRVPRVAATAVLARRLSRAPSAVAPTKQSLPFTGSNAAILLVWSWVFIATGGALSRVARTSAGRTRR